MIACGNKHTDAQGCITFVPAERQGILFFFFSFPCVLVPPEILTEFQMSF